MQLSSRDAVAAPVSGLFVLRLKDRRGRVLDEYVDHNMIVNGSKTALAQVISDPTASGKIVTKIAVGTGSTAPTVSDAGLTNPYAKTLDGHTFPAFNQVTFAWHLDYAEAVGLAITEFGLLCADGTLFARKTRGVLTKDVDLYLEGEWSLVF